MENKSFVCNVSYLCCAFMETNVVCHCNHGDTSIIPNFNGCSPTTVMKPYCGCCSTVYSSRYSILAANTF